MLDKRQERQHELFRTCVQLLSVKLTLKKCTYIQLDLLVSLTPLTLDYR